MHTPVPTLVVFIACPILALLFVIRIACAIFSRKSANQIRKHPIFHCVWGCIALVGILALIRGFAPNNPYGEPRDKISSWYVLPPVRLLPPLRAEYGRFYCVATEAPIAVSAGSSFLQIWKLGSFFQGPTSPLKLFNGIGSLAEYEHPIAISPDGNIVAVASDDEYGLSVVDWKNGKILWETNRSEENGYTGKHLVIGDNGKILFAAGAHTIERWDLLTGNNHSILHENKTNMNGIVRFLKTSRNGKVLIAGFGLPNGAGALSFAVWKVGENEPAFQSEEKDGASVDISPDGEWLALSRFGTEKLLLLNWRTGERKEVLLQDSHGFYSVLWSPDGKYLAVHTDSWPESIIIYETTNWKPITHWKYDSGSSFSFGDDGVLYEISGNELNAFNILR